MSQGLPSIGSGSNCGFESPVNLSTMHTISFPRGDNSIEVPHASYGWSMLNSHVWLKFTITMKTCRKHFRYRMHRAIKVYEIGDIKNSPIGNGPFTPFPSRFRHNGSAQGCVLTKIQVPATYINIIVCLMTQDRCRVVSGAQIMCDGIGGVFISPTPNVSHYET